MLKIERSQSKLMFMLYFFVLTNFVILTAGINSLKRLKASIFATRDLQAL